MKSIFVWTFFLTSTLLIAQNGINYKALIKDENGNVLNNSPVSIQFIIYEGAALNNNVYQESHTTNTDASGFIKVNIGEGSTGNNFNAINWKSDEHFLNVQVNLGSGLIDLGTTQFMTVPYALHAKTSQDNYWSSNSSGINTEIYRVGVNSETPEHTLDVRVPAQADAAELNVSNSDKSRYVRLFSGNDMFPNPSMTIAPGYDLLFASFDDNTLNFNEYFRISSLGNLGLGISNPEATLDIAGGDWNLEAGNPGDFRIGSLAHNFRIGVATGGGGAGITRMYTNSNELLLGTNNTADLKIDQDGILTAPSMNNTDIDNANNKVLITKEYLAANLPTETKVVAKLQMLSTSSFFMDNFTYIALPLDVVDFNLGGGTHNSVNGTFTIPVTGIYRITAIISTSFEASSVDVAPMVFRIYENETVIRSIQTQQGGGIVNSSYGHNFTYHDALEFNAGSVLDFRLLTTFPTGQGPRILGGAFGTSVIIEKIY